jgi:hypothetical protein
LRLLQQVERDAAAQSGSDPARDHITQKTLV